MLSRPWFTGLRGRLLLLVAVALMPAIGMLVAQGLERRRAETTELQAHALNLARLAAQAQERRVEGARQLLIALSNSRDIRSSDASVCTSVVRTLVHDYGGIYAEIGWADASGRVVCHALEGPPGISIADRDYFTRVMRTRTFAVGELMFGKIGGIPALAFAYPLKDATGTMTGVIFANVDLRVLSQSLASQHGKSGETLAVLDRNGAVLARSVDAEKMIGVKSTAAQLRVMTERREMVTTFDAPDGIRRVFAISTVHDPSGEPVFFVALGIPESQLLAGVDARLRMNILTIAVFGVGMLGAAWIGAEWLVRRPVKRLLDTTAALASGRLDTRAPQVGGVRELESLASAFNLMAERLEQRDVHLRQGQRLEAIGQLAGGIAHDFNNLLTIILGYGHSLREQLPPHSAAAAELSELRTAAERAAKLTQQLLAFSRRQVLSPKPLLLNDVVSQMQSLLHRTSGGRITLESVLDPHLRIVDADPAQMEQVILNLVINARDAMPDGGTVVIRTRNVTIGAEAAFGVAPGTYVELSVADNGIGMDHATQARIFEPFFTTKGPGGTGLGLATVYGIVKQSGGHITCTSEPGRGTCFTILLPPTTAAVERRARSVVEAPAGGSETIIVVEDEQAVRELIAIVLERRGYHVRATKDAEEALVWLQSDAAADLLITDVRMPGMGGLALYQHKQILRPGLPTLLISGDSAPLAVQMDDADAPPFLQKPFTPFALLRMVRASLDAVSPRPTPG